MAQQCSTDTKTPQNTGHCKCYIADSSQNLSEDCALGIYSTPWVVCR